jgi:hypothetical protein
VDLTGLEILLLSDTFKITELDINRTGIPPVMDWTRVFQALGRLSKLRQHRVHLGRHEARLLGLALCKIPSLQILDLAGNDLGSAGLVQLAPPLYHNTSIKELDVSYNSFNGMESAELLRDILRHNKIIITLDLSWNTFGQTTGASECIADGLGSNSTLLKIYLPHCALGDGGISTLAQTLGFRNTTLQKLTLHWNAITFTGVGVFLEAMEQSSRRITDIELDKNPIGNEGASLLARSLGNNALPNLTRLSPLNCDIAGVGSGAKHFVAAA